MDPRRLVGQALIVGFKGTQLDKKQLELLAKIQVGGVILFKQNFENLPQLVSLTNSIQRALIPTAPEGMPAWICVDQEGGRVQRFGPPFTSFSAAATLGKLNSPKTAFEAGYIVGTELKAAGVNVNFAPVVDVPDSLEAPGLGDRVFGTDPELVANVGSAAARGLQKGGVLGVAKHFPGHGGATVDSHVGLPTITKTVADFEAKDWIPFRRVIRARADGIMTAHVLCPALDPDRPATLSRKIIQEHLRKSLRHAKLIFSDDLDMGAIREKHDLKDAAFLALEAGCDHVLVCHSFDELMDLWEYLVKAVETLALPLKRMEESWARITEAKKRYLLPYTEVKLEVASKIVGCDAHKEVADAIRAGRAVDRGPSAEKDV